jgi:signal transduction histidine kinase
MSVTASRHNRIRGSGRARIREPFGVRVWFWTVGLGVLAGLGMAVGASLPTFLSSVSLIALWVAVTAAADLMPVTLWGSVTLSTSLPVTLAAGMLLRPEWAGLIAFCGAFDIREFRGEIGIARGLYNRGQVAVSVVLASAVFHKLGGDVQVWPEVLGVAFLMLSVDWIANTLLVAIPVATMSHLSPKKVVARINGDAPLEHLVGYVCLGLLAVFLAVVTLEAGEWGLVSFLFPLVLARQMLIRGRRLDEASEAIRGKDLLLASTVEHVYLERRDERMVVAGELHDEVLPPLFKVHLMGQVLRQDLNSGRLFDLDEDLPQLISATEAAQAAIRGLVKDLRRSPIGAGGLNSTIRLLAQQLESAGSPPITLGLQEVGGSHLSQLLVYQVAREALNNSARHSRASRIEVRLWKENGLIRLTVADDGIGFDPVLVDREAHFGLQLIVERMEAASGRVVIDSRLGRGTTVTAAMPPDIT